jgi:tRNA dimethylallyltransferase
MKKVLAIVGPTASGKTKLSIEVAEKINGEIISADSRQVYKYIPISTSHPSKEDLKKVRHYFVDELETEEEFNAGDYGKKGREVIDKIFLKGKQPVVVGGSGLYIRSLTDGLFEEEIKSKKVRKSLNNKLKLKGKEFLYNELKKVDKTSADKITPEDTRKVIRALEINYVSGKKISELQKKNAEINFETIRIGLLLDREYLYKRINERVDLMLKDGLIEEVKSLAAGGYDYRKNNSLNTVGIKEVYKYFEGEYDYDEMVRLIKQNSRRYAKRQMTWFRKDKRINWIEVKEENSIEDIAGNILAMMNRE